MERKSFLNTVENLEETGSINAIHTVVVIDGGAKTSGLFNTASEKHSQNKSFRTAVLVIALVAMMLSAFFAIKGSIVYGWNPLIAIVILMLNVFVAYVFYKKMAKGWKKIVCLSVEIISLICFGVAISVYFDIDKAQTVARQELVSSYTVMQNHYNAAADIRNILADAKSKAAFTAQQELLHGGKGVANAKAEAINNIAIPALPAMPAIPATKPFKTLTEANKWLQDNRADATKKIGEYDTYFSTIIKGSRSVNGSLDDVLSDSTHNKLNGYQRGSLTYLKRLLAGVLTQPAAEKYEPSDKLIGLDDLAAESGFPQGYIGLLVELIPIFLIFVLAYMSDDEKIEDIRDAEIRALLKVQLREEGISADPANLKKIEQEDLLSFTRKVFMSDRLLAYLKNGKASFDGLYDFSVEYPDLMYHLQEYDCKWNLGHIKTELAQNPEFADVFDEAIVVTRSDWKQRSPVASY